MGRPKLPPRTELHIPVEDTLCAKLKLHLYNPVLGRIPHGAYSQFFERLLLDFFSRQQDAYTPPTEFDNHVR